MDLSVNLNSVYEAEDDWTVRVERAAGAGADAVGVFGLEDPTPVAESAADHGLSFAYASSLVGPTNDPDAVATRVQEIADAVALASELGIEQLNVSPGRDLDGVDDASQFRAVVQTLRRAAPVARDAGVALLVEPLNTLVDHPNAWLNTVAEGVTISVAVDDPGVSVLFDVYHEQVEAGNVTDTLRSHADHVGHVHLADVPGRAEPGTGEIDFEFVLEALADTGFDGYVECEFWPDDDPDAAVRRVREMIA